MNPALPSVIIQWLERIINRDAIGAAECFSEDAAYYYAMPHPPVQGRDRIREMFSGQATAYARISWEVTTAAVQADRVWMERVWMERVDRFITPDGREIAIECAGVAEISDGLITEVRDYLDLQTWAERNRG